MRLSAIAPLLLGLAATTMALPFSSELMKRSPAPPINLDRLVQPEPFNGLTLPKIPKRDHLKFNGLVGYDASHPEAHSFAAELHRGAVGAERQREVKMQAEQDAHYSGGLGKTMRAIDSNFQLYRQEEIDQARAAQKFHIEGAVQHENRAALLLRKQESFEHQLDKHPLKDNTVRAVKPDGNFAGFPLPFMVPHELQAYTHMTKPEYNVDDKYVHRYLGRIAQKRVDGAAALLGQTWTKAEVQDLKAEQALFGKLDRDKELRLSVLQEGTHRIAAKQQYHKDLVELHKAKGEE